MLPYTTGVASFCCFSNFCGKPLVLVSSCLMGNKVRYDGQSKRHDGLFRHLLPWLQPLTVCPEAMAGMGIPRPPVRLIVNNGEVSARGRDDPSIDVTARLQQMARIQHNAHPLLAGALLQSRSPSCGVSSTPYFDTRSDASDTPGTQLPTGPGLFTSTLLTARPWLPTLEDTAFDAAHLRDRFLLKAYLCADWLYLQTTEQHAWQWLLDFFRHHDDSIRQLTLDEAETMQSLFVGSVPKAKQAAMRQTVDLFFVSKAGNYYR